MAPENMKKLVMMVFFQFGILLTLTIQCYGVVIAYQILQAKRLMLLNAYFSTKKNKWARRMKRLKVRRLCRKPRSTWVVKGRTDKWWENIVNGNAPDTVWKKNFRMSKQSFYDLVHKLHPVIGPKPNTPNYRYLTTEKKLAATLYYPKDTGSLWMTANTFAIHQCTVTKIITQVCHAINTVLGPTYLHLPRDVNEMREKASEFELKFGMIQAFGCIDVTHIAVKRPIDNSQDFFNYKQFFSINVQAICDSKGHFMDVECRWPGSVHDAKMFANSSVSEKLNNATLPITYISLLPGYEAIPNYIIADPAYPLTQFCMKEHQSCISNGQVLFNNMLRSARNQIECAFGRLKARWGFLSRKVDLKFESIPTVVYSCFVLHNYCEQNKDSGLDEVEVQFQIKRHLEEKNKLPNVPDQVYSHNNTEGELVRSVLTEYITHNLPDDYF